MSSLIHAQKGHDVILVSVAGGVGTEKRLSEMGLFRGEMIRVVNNSGAGPVIVSVKGSRLALGRGLAGKIMVREV